MSTGNVRPDSMERITTPALAQQFIEEQVKELRAQIGDKKVLLALSGGGGCAVDQGSGQAAGVGACEPWIAA